MNDKEFKKIALRAISLMICDCKEELENLPCYNTDQRNALATQVLTLATAYEKIKQA